MPVWVDLFVVVDISHCAVPPEERVVENEVGNEGPFLDGEIVAVPETTPEKPFWLAMVIVTVPTFPFAIVIVDGLAERLKSGDDPVVLKTAVCTVSGSGFRDPFVMVTHVLDTLVPVQPVWKPSGVPDAVPVML